MTDRTPLKGVFDAGKSIGLAEFVSGDTVAIAAGGTGKTTAATARTALGARHAKNYIINGGMRVGQRGDITVGNNFAKYGGPDRFLFTPWGWTSATGVLSQRDKATAQSGKCVQVWGITTTGNGSMAIATRLEAVDTTELKDKKFTVSAWVSHDFGASSTFTWEISRPNVADTFNTSNILSSTPVSVPHATATLLTATIDGASFDLTKGLQVSLYLASPGALTSKVIETWDWQLVEGESRITLDLPPYSDELARCQRYYEKGRAGGLINATAAGQYIQCYQNYKVTKAGSPTISATYAYSNAGSGAVSNISNTSLSSFASSSASGQASFYGDWICEAEL